jgi:hypothetical protein
MVGAGALVERAPRAPRLPAKPGRAQGFTWRRFQGKELFLLLTKHPFNCGTLAAAAKPITLPVLAVPLLAQRHIVAGLTVGVVKQ